MHKNRIGNILKNLDVIIAGAALLVLVCITFMGVIMRYIVGKPYIWQEELQIALFLWVVFFGSSAAFRVKGHVEITMIYDRLPSRVRRVVAALVYLVVAFCLLYLAAKGKDMVSMFLRTEKSTSVLSIPSALVYGIIPLCSILMLINYTLATYRTFRSERKTKEECR